MAECARRRAVRIKLTPWASQTTKIKEQVSGRSIKVLNISYVGTFKPIPFLRSALTKRRFVKGPKLATMEAGSFCFQQLAGSYPDREMRTDCFLVKAVGLAG